MANKRKKKRWPIVLVVLAVLALIGAVGGYGEDTTSDPRESLSASFAAPTPSPDPTDEPTTIPTEEPTSTSTPTPTKSPEPAPTKDNGRDYILNNSTKKFHYPSCPSVKQMSQKNKSSFHGTRETLIARGYKPCGNCHP